MAEITLDITAPTERRAHSFAGQSLSIGRGEAAELRIQAASLSRLHARLEQREGAFYLLDCSSSNGTKVNDKSVTTHGAKLRDGDLIRLGEDVTLRVHYTEKAPIAALPQWAVWLGGVVVVAVVTSLSAAGARAYKARRGVAAPPSLVNARAMPLPTASLAATPVSAATPNASPPLLTISSAQLTPYRKLGEAEQYEFLRTSAQHISRMMGNREYVFEPQALALIKRYVDSYAPRVGNGSRIMWGDDLHFLFERATGYAPLIITAFRQENVPIVVGLYIPMVETEYRQICRENFAGAMGLFQFIAPTARAYNVHPNDRCDAQIMAPAAARYIKDQITKFGTDPMSVALGIAAYNRNPASVMKDLQKVLNAENAEREFWTLVANSDKLDHYFQGENVKYVPKFFAAAILGEFPAHFGLRIRKLSTYDTRP